MPQTVNSNKSDANDAETVKFLYSYGGKILPRRTDGKLCYVGGHTRVLSVNRSITFAELMVRFGELCDSSMSLKCKLPCEDLDCLISITCGEDLANIIDEYDRYSYSTHKDLKIRTVLFPLETLKKVSPPISTVCSVDFCATASPPSAVAGFCAEAYGCDGRNPSRAVVGSPGRVRGENAGKVQYYPYFDLGSPSPRYYYHLPHRKH